MYEIKKVAVIGAGVMGGAIAAHLANAGISVNLLDIVPRYTDELKAKGIKEDDPKWRNSIVEAGLAAQLKLKPAPFYVKSNVKLIKTGNLTDNTEMLAEADWIIEVVVESLKIKHIVFDLVRKHRKKGSILTSNTSGISIKDMMEPYKDDKEFTGHFMVTHFFNPVRYMKLLELVNGEDTLPEVSETIATFGEKVLGKGIVFGKDTPNFIGNRIGVYSLMKTIQYTIQDKLKLDVVDKIMGPATGKPKSAVFRTGDVVGIDTLVHATNTVYDNAKDDDELDAFVVPDVVNKLVEKGWIGQKVRKGFYVKEGKEIKVLNLDTFEYESKEKVSFKSLKKAKSISNVGKRIKAVCNYKDKKTGEPDLAASFAWKVFRDTLIYSAKKLGEIADDVVNIDNAMKWGFNWELGPFETWDALGVRETKARIEAEGKKVPAVIDQLLEHAESFYKEENNKRYYFDVLTNEYKEIIVPKGVIYLKGLKGAHEEIYRNPSASIYNLGDGVLNLEFHTKMNAIDIDIINAQYKALELVEMKRYKGLVVTNQGEHFSAGANLMQVMMAVSQGKYDEVEEMARQLQYANMAFKYAKFPVVVAPHGLTFGGGAEISMHATHNRVLGETYLGLVEVGVGLIPGGGGTKELIFRNAEKFHKKNLTKVGRDDRYPMFWDAWRGHVPGPMFHLVKTFSTIGMAQVATSGPEAISFGYLKKENTRLTTNKDYLLADAKADVLEYAKNFVPKEKGQVVYLPGADIVKTAISMNLDNFEKLGLTTPHDRVVSMELANILGGGNTTYALPVTEERLLELERESFMRLLGMEDTQARIQHMLKTGKPLRN